MLWVAGLLIAIFPAMAFAFRPIRYPEVPPLPPGPLFQQYFEEQIRRVIMQVDGVVMLSVRIERYEHDQSYGIRFRFAPGERFCEFNITDQELCGMGERHMPGPTEIMNIYAHVEARVPWLRLNDEMRALRNAAGAVTGVDDLPPDQPQTATEVHQIWMDQNTRLRDAEGRTYGELVQQAYNAVRARSEAEQRSMELLRSRLSASQLEEFDRLNAFDVVGSDTGKCYRITKGTVSNVLDLDAGQRMCFVPAGNLSVGDVMLAQKIALETNESAALAVANRGMLMPMADGSVIFREMAMVNSDGAAFRQIFTTDML